MPDQFIKTKLIKKVVKIRIYRFYEKCGAGISVYLRNRKVKKQEFSEK